MAIPLGPGDPALTYALGGVMRGGVGRAGVTSGFAFISVDGAHVGHAGDSYRSGVLADGAAVYFRLDELAGNVVSEVGNAIGTVEGTVTRGFLPGALADGNAAIAFRGTGRVLTTTAITLPVTFTVEAWIQTQAAGQFPVFSDRIVGATPNEVYLGGQGGFVFAYMVGAVALTGTRVVNDGAWHHVVYTSTGTTVALYVDGTLDASVAGNRPVAITNPWYIAGDVPNNQRFAGAVDEVAVYPFVLTAAQIAAHYAKRTWAAHTGIILSSLSIADALDETPNHASFRTNGYVPITGNEVVITLGSKNRLQRMFAGHALTVDQRYAADRPANVQADVVAVDYTWLLGFSKVTRRYVNQSASAIIQDLIATDAAAVANGFTAYAVVADLPVIDEITFTNEDLPTAITRTVRRVGAYWYVDYNKRVHAFVSEVDNGTPTPLTPTHPSLADFTRPADRTQVLSRVYVEGRGTRLLASVNAYDSRLPVAAVDMFAVAPDVFLKASFRGAEGGAQHADFTGVVDAGGGTLVGPGVGPGTGPILTAQSGGAIDIGVHDYAYTWVTAAGETKPSAATRVTAAILPTPTATPALQYDTSPVDPQTSGSWRPGDMIEWAYSWTSGSGPTTSAADSTALSPIHGPIACIASPYTTGFGNPPGSCAQGFNVGAYHSSDPNVKWIEIWHRVNGGAWRIWLSPNLQNQVAFGGSYQWSYAYNRPANYSQDATPSVSAPSIRMFRVDGIAVGPVGVTGRKLYRTKANASQLQLLVTMPNNVATDYIDAADDTTLTTNAPTGDTSGIAQPTGQVNPGASSVIVASTLPFRTDGGWAVLGNGAQVVRYTGISGGALVGIPATGRGSLTAVVVYNTTITAPPMLIGIPTTGPRALSIPLTDGDEIYFVVMVENVALQAALAAALKITSGAREEWIQDRRLSIAEARARGQATLALRPQVQVSVRYTCRDLLTKSGKTITVNLPAPTNVVGDYKIQQVTIHNFRPYANQHPTFTVDASSSRFSFEDLLNRFKVTV